MDIKELMIKEYAKLSACDSYILGFVDNGKVYMAKVKSIEPKYLTVEKASRNQGENLRLRIRKEHRADFENAICLGSKDTLIDNGHLNAKGEIKYYNKGEMFEKLVTEYYGLEWNKDTIPFWVQGDIRVDNEEIQIKLSDATLTSTKQLAKLIVGA